MESGYIYISKNLSFKDGFLKIGRTNRDPLERKNELYKNSTGVPEPFMLIFYRRSCDQLLSEKKVHSVLDAYRHNNKREFFCISVDAAKNAINGVCDEVEIHHGNKVPPVHEVSFELDNSEYTQAQSTIVEPDFSNIDTDGEWVDPRRVISQPFWRSELTEEQISRVKVIATIFSFIHPENPEWRDVDDWVESFTKDAHPEVEIRIWENMAKAYIKFSQSEKLNDLEKLEAYEYIQRRSQSSKKKVKSIFHRLHLSKRKFKKLVGLCKWKAVPIKAVRIGMPNNGN